MALLRCAARKIDFPGSAFSELGYPKVVPVTSLRYGIRRCVYGCQGICLKKKKKRVSSVFLTGSIAPLLLFEYALLVWLPLNSLHDVVAERVKKTLNDQKGQGTYDLNDLGHRLLSYEKLFDFTVRDSSGTSSSSKEGAKDKRRPMGKSPLTLLHSLYSSLHSISRLFISAGSMFKAYGTHADPTPLRSFSLACTPAAQKERGLRDESEAEDAWLYKVKQKHKKERKAHSRGLLAATWDLLHHILHAFSRAFKKKVIPFILKLFRPVWPTKPTSPPCETELLQEYDFVVIGSGAGGAVLAGRLSSLLKSKEEMEREAAAAARAELKAQARSERDSTQTNNGPFAGRPPSAEDSREEKTYAEEGEGRKGMGNTEDHKKADGTSTTNRLKIPKVRKHPTVLIVEAGGLPDLHFFSSHVVPLRAGENQQSDIDWSYQTVPQKHACKALKHASSRWPRGKVGGGSTILTYMLFVRGHPSDYDSWAACIGDPSWRYENVEKYFKRAERVQFHADVNSRKHRGRKGPLPAWRRSSIGEDDVGVAAFLHAAVAAGHRWNEDFNAGAPEGVAQMQFNVQKGRRITPFQAYLYTREFNEKRDLLHALFHVRAVKIRFHKQTKKATAVQLVEEKSCNREKWEQNLCRVFEVGVAKEVLLAAGAIESPHLLELSGVGAADRLHQLGIQAVAHLPAVGENLQDHVFVPRLYRLKKEITDELYRHLMTRPGAMSRNLWKKHRRSAEKKAKPTGEGHAPQQQQVTAAGAAAPAAAGAAAPAAGAAVPPRAAAAAPVAESAVPRLAAAAAGPAGVGGTDATAEIPAVVFPGAATVGKGGAAGAADHAEEGREEEAAKAAADEKTAKRKAGRGEPALAGKEAAGGAAGEAGREAAAGGAAEEAGREAAAGTAGAAAATGAAGGAGREAGEAEAGAREAAPEAARAGREAAAGAAAAGAAAGGGEAAGGMGGQRGGGGGRSQRPVLRSRYFQRLRQDRMEAKGKKMHAVESINKTRIVRVKTLLSYVFRGKGILATSGVDAHVVTPQLLSRPREETAPYLSRFPSACPHNLPLPDIQILFYNSLPEADVFMRNMNLPSSFEKVLGSPQDWKSLASDANAFGVIILPVLLHPRSRGFVRTVSANPFLPPLIDPNYLHDKQDVRLLVEGLKLVEALAEQPPLRDVLRNELLPTCKYLRRSAAPGRAKGEGAAAGVMKEKQQQQEQQEEERRQEEEGQEDERKKEDGRASGARHLQQRKAENEEQGLPQERKKREETLREKQKSRRRMKKNGAIRKERQESPAGGRARAAAGNADDAGTLRNADVHRVMCEVLDKYERKEISEDAFLEMCVRYFTQSLYHPTGTCRAGTADSSTWQPTLKRKKRAAPSMPLLPALRATPAASARVIHGRRSRAFRLTAAAAFRSSSSTTSSASSPVSRLAPPWGSPVRAADSRLQSAAVQGPTITASAVPAVNDEKTAVAAAADSQSGPTLRSIAVAPDSCTLTAGGTTAAEPHSHAASRTSTADAAFTSARTSYAAFAPARDHSGAAAAAQHVVAARPLGAAAAAERQLHQPDAHQESLPDGISHPHKHYQHNSSSRGTEMQEQEALLHFGQQGLHTPDEPSSTSESHTRFSDPAGTPPAAGARGEETLAVGAPGAYGSTTAADQQAEAGAAFAAGTRPRGTVVSSVEEQAEAAVASSGEEEEASAAVTESGTEEELLPGREGEYSSCDVAASECEDTSADIGVKEQDNTLDFADETADITRVATGVTDLETDESEAAAPPDDGDKTQREGTAYKMLKLPLAQEESSSSNMFNTENTSDDIQKLLEETWSYTAVVDGQLRLCGNACVHGVRVVDASVMPHMTSGSTQIPTVMIAEKAVEMIAEEWNYVVPF